MAIKSNIIDFPLTGELNLSKNKIDVNNPAQGGYLKNDGVYYGNVLSPVYRQNTAKTFDYIDDNNDEFVVGSSTLTKNDTEIMSFTNKSFKRTQLETISHIDSLYDEDHYITVEGATATIHCGDIPERTVSGTIYATKLIPYDGNTWIYAIFYTNNFGMTILQIGNWNGSSWSYWNKPIATNNNTAPIINHYNYQGKIIINLITDSGSYVGNHDSFTYVLDIANNRCTQGVYNTEAASTSYNVLNSYNLKLRYVCTKYNINNASGNQIWITADELPETVYYRNGSNYREPVHVYLRIQELENWTRAEDAVNTTYDPYASLGLKVNTGWNDYDARENLGRNPFLTQRSLSNNDLVKYVLWVEVYYVSEWVDNPTQAQIDAKTNDTCRFMFIPEVSFLSYKTSRPTSGFYNVSKPATYFNGDTFCTISKATDSVTSQRCNAILDDGTLIQTKMPAVGEDDVYNQGLYNFTGEIDSVTYSGTVHYIDYTINDSSAIVLGQSQGDNNNKYPYANMGGSISFDHHYFRSNIVSKGSIPIDEDGNYYKTTLLFDSGIVNDGGGVLLQSGYGYNVTEDGVSDNFNINAGSVVQNGKWRILYNNNLVTGISYSEYEASIGTLLTDWNSVGKVLSIQTDKVYYLDNSGNLIKIEVQEKSEALEYNVIRNRYLVVNTISYYNCWDMLLNQRVHWASDWNNRCFQGMLVPNKLKVTVDNDSILNNMQIESFYNYASAQNANYEMTLGRSLSSAIFPPEALLNVYVRNKPIFLRGTTTEAIDFYSSNSQKNANNSILTIYEKTYKNNVYYKEVQLEGADYPVGIVYYNPNIFSKFIQTYNNNDMIINNGVATPLQKSNNGSVLMLFNELAKGLENMENIFVLQTLYYGIGDNKIWEIYYDNSTISNYQAIIDVKGMIYLGQLPTEALFWSPLNRSIYSFTGDAILKQLWHCNDISTIYDTFYNPSTQELFVSTDKGLLCISNQYTYLLTEYVHVYDMFFFADHFWAITDVNTGVEVLSKERVLLSYEWDAQGQGFTGTNLSIKTKYLGSIENYKIHINAVYIKFAKVDGDNRTSVGLTETTLTDKSTTTNRKAATIEWDGEGDFGFLRYQPQYQKGTSISFEIESPAPIISMSVGYNVLDENGQIGRTNA